MTVWQNVAVVVNPRSANGRTGKRWPVIGQAIKDLIGDFTLLRTEGPNHATSLVQEALREGHDRIVSVGGDGTHYEVVNGFFNEGVPVNPRASLVILPCGTGSDLARTLGLSRDIDAVPLVNGARTVKADVGRVTFACADGEKGVRHFINVADFGAGGAVVDQVNRTGKVFGGFLSFLTGIVATLVTFRSPALRLQIDGEQVEQRCLDVIVANGRYYGGGIHVAPEARLHSGVFEVFVINDIGFLKALANLRTFYTGALKTRPDLVHCFRATQVIAESDETVLLNLDGEIPGKLPATFELLPSALNLVVG